MKLLRGARNDNPSRFFCYKFFKYVIWVSISLYFFSSFFITRHKPTISTTTISHSKPSRALMEEQPRLDSSTLGLFEGMKIYVYDLSEKFNDGWLANKRCSRHLFAAEVAIRQVVKAAALLLLWRRREILDGVELTEGVSGALPRLKRPRKWQFSHG